MSVTLDSGLLRPGDGMRARTAAWVIAGAEIAVYLAAVVLCYLARSAFARLDSAGFANQVVLAMTPMLAFPLFGGLIAGRRPSNPIGWICLASGAAWFLNFLASNYAVYGLVTHPGLPAAAAAGALNLWVPAVGLLGTYLFLLFPDGELLSRRWRSVGWLSGLAIAVFTFALTVAPGPVANVPGSHNPLAPRGQMAEVVKALGLVFPVLFGCIVASVVSLVLRYRRARADERQKLKWIAFAGVVFVLIYGATILGSVLFQGPHTPMFVQFLQGLASASFALMPAASFFAVLRFRLYDIDRVISRTLGYLIITATLGGTYAVLALVPTAIVGTGRAPSGVVAGSVLVVAALFRPLRRRVQNAIDHRFNRARYDAERTVEAFAIRLRDEIDIDTLKIDLEMLVQSTMAPEHVSLWLRDSTT
jgi:hypothetical protein